MEAELCSTVFLERPPQFLDIAVPDGDVQGVRVSFEKPALQFQHRCSRVRPHTPRPRITPCTFDSEPQRRSETPFVIARASTGSRRCTLCISTFVVTTFRPSISESRDTLSSARTYIISLRSSRTQRATHSMSNGTSMIPTATGCRTRAHAARVSRKFWICATLNRQTLN